MNRMVNRLEGVVWALCLGCIALFAFFFATGGFSPGDVAWLTIAVGLLALAFCVHAVQVRRVLRGARSGETLQELNRLRERRGF